MVRHVERVDPSNRELATAITADVSPDAADVALNILTKAGIAPEDVYVLTLVVAGTLKVLVQRWLRARRDRTVAA